MRVEECKNEWFTSRPFRIMENNPQNPVMEQSSANLEEDLASAITSEPEDLSFVMAEESIQHIQQAQIASDVMTQSKYAQVLQVP